MPIVTKNLIIINALIFLADTLLFRNGSLDSYLALHYFSSDHFMPHQIITCMFMHGSLSHLFFNMFAVFMFGRTLEMIWGPKKFLLYYMIAGIGASLLQLFVMYLRVSYIEASIPPEQLPAVLSMIKTEGYNLLMNQKNYTDPAVGALNLLVNGGMVGASGAVFGILVAFGMIFPNSELFIIPFPFPIKAKWFVIGYGVLELTLGIVDSPTDNVAHFAHLGGLFTGLILLLYWRKRGKLTTNDGSFQR
ncbi:MAG: rhomboid family intramembrane serine protease [Dysgonomonas sp.]